MNFQNTLQPEPLNMSSLSRSGSILASGRIGPNQSSTVAKSSKSIKSARSVKPYSRKSKNGPGPFPVKLRGAMFAGVEPIPTDPTRDPPPRACYNCWQHGHSRRHCPRPVAARYCNNCGRRGEDLNTCPRCKLAHARYLARVQEQESGEQLDSDERLLSELEYSNEGDEDDGCDDVLRELMLQDERAREVSNGRPEAYHSGHVDLEMLDEYERYKEAVRAKDAFESAYRERRSCVESKQRYEDEVDAEYERDRWRKKERDERTGSQERDASFRQQNQSSSAQDSSGARITSDPVQDILLLAKTISHLSPETQDLIMRQVIAERKEYHARLKARETQEEDTWP